MDKRRQRSATSTAFGAILLVAVTGLVAWTILPGFFERDTGAQAVILAWFAATALILSRMLRRLAALVAEQEDPTRAQADRILERDRAKDE